MPKIGFVGLDSDYVEKLLSIYSKKQPEVEVEFRKVESMLSLIIEHINAPFSITVVKVVTDNDFEALLDLKNVIEVTNSDVLLAVVIEDDSEMELRLVKNGILNYFHYEDSLEIQVEKFLSLLASQKNSKSFEVVKFGDWTYYPTIRLFKNGTDRVKLTPLEGKVLMYLFLKKGQVISREELFMNVNTHKMVTDGDIRSIDVHVSNIRKKTRYDLILTVSGKGYCININ